MKKRFSFLILQIFIFSSLAFGREVTLLQFFYTAKNVFPDVKEISIFLPAEQQAAEQPKIASAAAKMGLTVKLFLIDDAKSIGSNIKLLGNNTVLLVYDSPVLMEKSSRLFILSKSKEMQVPVITSSRDYSDSGALLGLFPDENNKLKLIVNLQHSPYLSAKFTDEFNQKIGAAEVIR